MGAPSSSACDSHDRGLSLVGIFVDTPESWLVRLECSLQHCPYLGGYRDRTNIEADFRQIRAGTPFEWVVPHVYRKTVATLLDEGGGLS